MDTRNTNPNFLNGVPQLLILRLLQRKEMYGYEIVETIHASTDAVITIGEGVVYPVLHTLESEGALEITPQSREWSKPDLLLRDTQRNSPTQ